ncbi:lipocalin-like domain-containing protein [Fischerella thermalis]|uniref:lipocalin-like domain-containing protein n=1 Tax=Fischerella thermalis TaxID=372787 RepID=UPI00241F68B3|nr:lipocalin-like domain-containing protein [Fischerella thermalis]
MALTGDIRSPFSKEIQSLPPQECLQVFSTFNAYAGIYTIEGNTVTHHVEIASIPGVAESKYEFTIYGCDQT